MRTPKIIEATAPTRMACQKGRWIPKGDVGEPETRAAA